MGTYTTNLNLYNTNMTTDGNDTFDFQRDINDNNDKIDAYAGTVNSTLTTKADKSYADSMLNCIYEGVNLETKFATEIAQYADKYTWLQTRKNNNNYDGIHVGDYFYVPMSAGTVGSYSVSAQTFKCRIVGLNTYKNCGDNPIGNMIYCISDEVINTPMVWNPQNNNNGTSIQNNPYLASAIYAYLNGVNNYTTSAYGGVAHGANANNNGVLQKLPSSLQNKLVTKRNLLEKRYSSSGLLTGGTDWSWQDMGKLWLPTEIEVYGTQIRSNTCQTANWWNPEANLSIQFAWFANNCQHRLKTLSDGTSRASWWLASPASHSSTNACDVHGSGTANRDDTTDSTIYAPLCFCI